MSTLPPATSFALETALISRYRPARSGFPLSPRSQSLQYPAGPPRPVGRRLASVTPLRSAFAVQPASFRQTGSFHLMLSGQVPRSPRCLRTPDPARRSLDSCLLPTHGNRQVYRHADRRMCRTHSHWRNEAIFSSVLRNASWATSLASSRLPVIRQQAVKTRSLVPLDQPAERLVIAPLHTLDEFKVLERDRSGRSCRRLPLAHRFWTLNHRSRFPIPNSSSLRASSGHVRLHYPFFYLGGHLVNRETCVNARQGCD